MTMYRARWFNGFLGFASIAALAGALGCSEDDEDPVASGGKSGNAGSAGRPSGGGGSGGSGGTSAGTGGGGPSAGTAELRVVHAAPGAPAVDLYAKGSASPFAEALAYGEATDFVELPAGTYEVEVRPAGADATDPAVFTTPAIAIAGGKSYTAIAAGDLASDEASEAFRVVPIENAFGAGDAGEALVRIVHAGVDAPTVDVNLGNDGGEPEIAALDRFADTAAAGFSVPSGMALQVGIESGGDVVTAFTTPELPDRGEVLIVATGKLGSLAREEEGFALLAVLSDGAALIRQNPRVYALHASPDAGPVDLFVGPTELVNNAAFGDLAGVQVPPGEYTIDFFPGTAAASTRPSGDPAASATTPELEAGESYLAVAAGELTRPTPTFRLIAAAEQFALDGEGARLRVIHASADAPEVDLGAVATSGNIQTPALLRGLAFGDISPAAGLGVDAGALRIGLSAAGTTPTAAEFAIAPEDGQRAFVVAAGDFGGTSNAFQLLVVDASSTPWSVAAVEPE